MNETYQRHLETTFFERPVLQVAPDLLGCTLHAPGGRGMITEVEAYDGEQDLACHASKGRTPRTDVMYGPAGHWYVYLVYGMHYMLNVVTGDEGHPAAVLIRTVEPYDGPGKLTKALGVDMAFNGRKANKKTGLWLESGDTVDQSRIQTTPRIGVNYAKEWAKKPYRFVLEC